MGVKPMINQNSWWIKLFWLTIQWVWVWMCWDRVSYALLAFHYLRKIKKNINDCTRQRSENFKLPFQTSISFCVYSSLRTKLRSEPGWAWWCPETQSNTRSEHLRLVFAAVLLFSESLLTEFDDRQTYIFQSKQNFLTYKTGVWHWAGDLICHSFFWNTQLLWQ